MIEFGGSSVVHELVAMRFEVDSVAVRPCTDRTQSAEGKRSEAIVMKPVARRDHVNRRVQCSVVDDRAAHFLTPRTIAVHANVNRAARSTLKVSHADSFGERNVVIEEIAVADIGLY